MKTRALTRILLLLSVGILSLYGASDVVAEEPVDTQPSVPRLLQDLEHADPAIRAAAADTLAESKPPEALPKLKQLVTGGERPGTLAAARALRGYAEDREVLALLIPVSDTNHEAASAVLAQGAKSFELLVTLLGKGKPADRKAAATLLGKLGDKRAIPPLEEAAKSADAQLAFVAKCSLGALEKPVVLSKTVSQLRDVRLRTSPMPPVPSMGIAQSSDPPVSSQETIERAKKAAAQSEEKVAEVKEEGVEALLEALTSPDAVLAEKAAVVLGQMQSPEAVEPLCHALRTRGLTGTAMALGMIGDSRAVPTLLEALETGLASTEPPSQPTGGHRRDGRETETMLACAWALAEIRDPKAVPALITLLENENYGAMLERGGFRDSASGYIVSGTLKQLLRFEDPRSIPLLFRRAKDGHFSNASMIASFTGKEAAAALYALCRFYEFHPEAQRSMLACLIASQVGEDEVRRLRDAEELEMSVGEACLTEKYGEDYQDLLLRGPYALEFPEEPAVLFLCGDAYDIPMALLTKNALAEYDIDVKPVSVDTWDPRALERASVLVVGPNLREREEALDEPEAKEREQRLQAIADAIAESRVYTIGLGGGGLNLFDRITGLYLGPEHCDWVDGSHVRLPAGQPIRRRPCSLPSVFFVARGGQDPYAEGVNVPEGRGEAFLVLAEQCEAPNASSELASKELKTHRDSSGACIVEEKGKYLFCGAFGFEILHDPRLMSAHGRKLLVNLVHHGLAQTKTSVSGEQETKEAG